MISEQSSAAGISLEQVIITPGAWLRSGDDSGDVGIFVASLPRLVGLSNLGLFATSAFLLLAFLFRAFARALLLSDFGPVRHGESPSMCDRVRGYGKRAGQRPAPGKSRGQHSRFGHPM